MTHAQADSTNSRSLAAQKIHEWLDTDAFVDHLLEGEIADRAFITEVLYGVARQKRKLDWILNSCTDRRPDPEIVPYLLVGIYQLMMMDTVAEHAAVNETVQAAKDNPAVRHAAGFINAVLRRVIRDRQRLADALQRKPDGVRLSHPDILIDRWTKTFGQDRMQHLCEWNNDRPCVSIRVNKRLTSIEAFTGLLDKADTNATPHTYAPDEFLVLPRGVSVRSVPGYEDGLFSVQDPSTTVAVTLLDPQPGEVVLDACAAPGGKTLLMGEMMDDTGILIAADISPRRLALVKQNVRRMKLTNVTIAEFNASRADSVGGHSQFDRILLDVPCSNTGVLRRRPDARWRFSKNKLKELIRLQRTILSNTAGMLKPGGTLVYSTCSLESEEGHDLIAAWRRVTPDFALMDEITIFPPDKQMDGIYAAAIRREK